MLSDSSKRLMSSHSLLLMTGRWLETCETVVGVTLLFEALLRHFVNINPFTNTLLSRLMFQSILHLWRHGSRAARCAEAPHAPPAALNSTAAGPQTEVNHGSVLEWSALWIEETSQNPPQHGHGKIRHTLPPTR
ncbi:hypothetical protein MHYP_G00020990 [Metynnis hypsauchen]